MDRIQDWNTSYITLQIPVPLQISWTNKAVDNYNLIRGWWLDNTADLLQIISFQNWPNIIYFKI